jgi:hypothetical protein
MMRKTGPSGVGFSRPSLRGNGDIARRSRLGGNKGVMKGRLRGAEAPATRRARPWIGGSARWAVRRRRVLWRAAAASATRRARWCDTTAARWAARRRTLGRRAVVACARRRARGSNGTGVRRAARRLALGWRAVVASAPARTASTGRGPFAAATTFGAAAASVRGRTSGAGTACAATSAAVLISLVTLLGG